MDTTGLEDAVSGCCGGRTFAPPDTEAVMLCSVLVDVLGPTVEALGLRVPVFIMSLLSMLEDLPI